MTKIDALEFVRCHADDDSMDQDELRAAFRALYVRAPDAQDEEEGLWSHLCAAVKAE
jgi:hypothetical protein